MAFITIPDSWLTVGEAIKKRLFIRVKDNLDDHETRLNAVEQGVNKVTIFNFEVMGFISNYTAAELTGISTYRAPQDLIITEVKIAILNSSSTPTTSSSAGSLSIDLQKSTNGGATWASVLVSQPTIGDGHYLAGEESNLVSFNTGGEILLQDELLRVSVTSKKDSQGSFQILCYGDLS
jgi:hypothetical protein